MTTQTISAISTPSRRAVALGATVALVVAALFVGAIAGAGAAAWWQARTTTVTSSAAVAVPRVALDPAAHQYGARAAELESAVAVTGAPLVVARPVLDPQAHQYGARVAELDAVSAAGVTSAVRTSVDPESRYYGRTRLVRPSSPDVAPKVAVAQVRTPETHLYGVRSGS